MSGGSQVRFFSVFALLVALSGCGNLDQVGETLASVADRPTGGNDLFGPYRVVEGWQKPMPDPTLAQGWTWGSFGGVFVENEDRIWMAMRGVLPLPEGAAPWTPWSMLSPSRGSAPANSDGLGATCQPAPSLGIERQYRFAIHVVDRSGDVIEAWEHHDDLFDHPSRCGRGPHKIKMNPYDPERHVWVIDDQLHVIHRFTYEGELVHTLGEFNVPGRGPNNFARPTDIAWLSDGTYFISDGYDGTRIAKFDAHDNFIMDWGSAPQDAANPGPAEFSNPHSIQISADRRLFVVDRGHERIQVFTEEGEFLYMWSLREDHWPAGVRSLATEHIIDEAQNLWVGDASLNRISKYDLDGNFVYSWGMSGGQPGQLGCPHQMSTDDLGNLYVADCFQGRVQKFAPLPYGDRSLVVGREHRFRD